MGSGRNLLNPPSKRLFESDCGFWEKAYYVQGDDGSLSDAKEQIRKGHEAECPECSGTIIFGDD